ncbi:MAG: hypothetical protein ACXWUG_22275 [Polyangiales bacterium]
MKYIWLALLLLTGCPPNAKDAGVRCGADGHPPPEAADIGTLLLTGQPESCPRAQPREGSPCALPLAPTKKSESSDEPWECMYRRPDQGPCEYDSCTCTKSKSGELAWSCSPVME